MVNFETTLRDWIDDSDSHADFPSASLVTNPIGLQPIRKVVHLTQAYKCPELDELAREIGHDPKLLESVMMYLWSNWSYFELEDNNAISNNWARVSTPVLVVDTDLMAIDSRYLGYLIASLKNLSDFIYEKVSNGHQHTSIEMYARREFYNLEFIAWVAVSP